MRLYDRQQELEHVTAALHDATNGCGGVLVVEGPPGIGKTLLLRAAAEHAEAEGFDVFCARGGELEASFPFGIVRQFFEHRLVTADEEPRAELLAGAAGLSRPVFGFDEDGSWTGGMMVSDEASYPRLHGLYWLAANLTAARPLLLVVDDAHWSDTPSLRWIDYLAARVADLPILVLLASRPLQHDGAERLLATIMTAARVMRPGPLSPPAVRAVVAEQLGAEPDQSFCDTCTSATGGNPFLLHELLSDLSRSGVTPTREAAARVGALGPTAVSRRVELRLVELGDRAVALARAVALLGASAKIRHAAALLDWDERVVAAEAARLADVGILEPDAPLRFVHPVVRTAIHADAPTAMRIEGHARAAHILAEEGAERELIAMHLLETPPAQDPWSAAMLLDAGRRAIVRGAPGAAVRYLRRALDDAVDEDFRVTILTELGSAAIHAGDPTAVEVLDDALAHVRDPARRAEIALELGRALVAGGRLVEAVERLSSVLEWTDLEPDTALRIEAELIAASRLDARTRHIAKDRLARVNPKLSGTRPGERLMLAHLAYDAVTLGEPSQRAAELATRALHDGALLAEAGCESPTYFMAAWSLGLCDRLADAYAVLTAAIEVAGRQGSALGFAIAASFRASVGHWSGALDEAEADARSVLDADAHGWHQLGHAFLVDVLVDRGRLAEAERLLGDIGMLGEVPDNMLFQPLLYARGEERLAAGLTAEGVTDLLEAGRRAAAAQIRSPAFRAWRSKAALGLERLGRSEEARALAAEEMELARRFGSPRALGIALRATGLLEGGAAGRRRLAESVSVLRDSESRLQYALSLVELGAATRRAGERRTAGEFLREGLELAHRCGAEPLVERARSELAQAGSRQRRPVRRGVDALTASERRVAHLAAEGMSNREIAQALFVTLKTVEWHLGQAYQKLGIARRGQLAHALAARPESVRRPAGAPVA